MNGKHEDILKQTIEHFGTDHQLNMAIEEMSELTKEICKYKRGADNLEAIIEEMADVYVMLWQMEMIFHNGDKVYDVVCKKIERLHERYLKENKSTPKKPLNQTYIPINFETIGKCPSCGERVINSIGGKQKECSCGQALDWSK